jgi:hypothetical protein
MDDGRLIHLGHGRTTVLKGRADYIDPTVAHPRVNNRFVLNRPARPSRPWLVMPLPRPRKPRYGQRPILDLQTDHCRYLLPGGLYCGSESVLKSSWCGEHHRICLTNSPYRK